MAGFSEQREATLLRDGPITRLLLCERYIGTLSWDCHWSTDRVYPESD